MWFIFLGLYVAMCAYRVDQTCIELRAKERNPKRRSWLAFYQIAWGVALLIAAAYLIELGVKSL